MFSYFKALWTDQTVFIGVVRALAGTLGIMMETGKMDAALSHLPAATGDWLGVALIAAALFMRSSSSSSVPAKPK